MSWPVKNAAYTFYVALVDSASRPAFKADPTLASGDVKVSIDGGAFANLGTLPDAEPNSSRAIRVQMAQAEMNGDDIVVQFVDAAGAEWDDLIVHVQTTTRSVDNLCYPTTSGRSIDVDASGGVEVGSFQAGAITAAAIADGAIDRATFAVDTGLQTIRSGTLQSATSTTAVLDAGASATDNIYRFDLLYLTTGTGAGQVRVIASYNGTTKTVTLTSTIVWIVTPDNTTTFAILPANAVIVDDNGRISASSVTGSVGSVTNNVGGNVLGTVSSIVGNVGGNVVGSVGSLTTNNDKTGYALSATGSAALTESYAADGAAGTLPQLLYMLLAVLTEANVSSTTLTAKKLDGSTTAATFTLDSETSPTSITRAT